MPSLSKRGWLMLVAVLVLLFAGVYRAFLVADTEGDGSLKMTGTGDHAESFYAVTVDPRVDDLRFVWGDSEGQRYGSIGKWKEAVEGAGKALVFAMNGGMYVKGGDPKGLYVEGGVKRSEIDLLKEGYGNFYMQPNGVLFVTNEGKAVICQTAEFRGEENVRFATQSGPMLLVNKKINEKFRVGSDSVHIRNGVGLLEDGRLLFAMSKEKVSFHELAYFFQQRGCVDALYLDGFVSRMYAPSVGVSQEGGDFGVMIGVVK